MAITRGNITTYNNSNGTWPSPARWNHTVPSGSNRVLYVIIHEKRDVSAHGVNGVNYNDVAMSNIFTASIGQSSFSVWRLINPPIGTYYVTVTFSPYSDYPCCISVDYSNVNQTTPNGTPVTGSGNSASPAPNMTITPRFPAASVMVGFFGLAAPSNIGINVSASATELTELSNSNGVIKADLAQQNTSASYSMQFSWSGTYNYFQCLIEILPAAGVGYTRVSSWL